MFAVQQRNSSPTKAEIQLGTARPRSERIPKSEPNLLWRRLATQVRMPTAATPAETSAGSVMSSSTLPLGDALGIRQTDFRSSASSIEVAEGGLQGPGEALPLREPLERSFGVDLQPLRLHSGPEAQAACDRLGAAAYTLNNHIAVRAAPSPWLLAHEVAHTVQQSGRGLAGGSAVSGPEEDADRAATAATSGQRASVRASASSGTPQCFRLTAATQTTYPKMTAYLHDEMPKVANDARLLKSLAEGARTTESAVRAGLAWDTGPWVTPKTLRGTRAGLFHPHQGSQEVEIHKDELDKWQAETDSGLNEAYEFWLETVVLHEYVHYLGDNREKDKDEEWGKDFEEKAYGNLIATRDAAWNLEHFLRARFGDGDYEVKVTGKEAAFKQRFRVVGADVGNGTYDGVVGTAVKVSKAFDLKGRWEVFVEHDDGKAGWQPSKIRIVFVSIGDEWLIRTEDWTDRDFNDLEIAVKRTGFAKPPPAKKP